MDIGLLKEQANAIAKGFPKDLNPYWADKKISDVAEEQKLEMRGWKIFKIVSHNLKTLNAVLCLYPKFWFLENVPKSKVFSTE